MPGRARLSGPAVPLICAAVGLLVGLAVTLLQDSTYRADASIVLVREGQPPGSDPQLAEAAEAAAELFDSRAVAESAARNLGLEDTPEELLDRVEVEAAEGSSLVRIQVEAPSAEEARRTAQEVAEVATVLFNDRFAPDPTASVWEPASAMEERVSPKPARNLALGALIGALVGLAIVLASMLAQVPSRPAPSPKRRPAPEPVEPPAEPQPAAPVEPAPAPAPPSSGGPTSAEWTLPDLERLFAEQGSAFPERQEELEIYLESLRSVAAPDGSLPLGVEQVIEDVFRPLLDRAAGRT